MVLNAADATVETLAYTYDDAGRLTRAANNNLLPRTVTSDGEVTYTLIYRADTGGAIDGQPVVTQPVALCSINLNSCGSEMMPCSRLCTS